VIKISFYINGQFKSLIIKPELTLLELIRNKLQLTGVKEVCTEGDCGACTVIIAKVENGEIKYHNINSCIYPAVKIHGAHVITLEGISQNGKLNPVQQKMVDNYAIQCGYCTSGIILSLITYYINKNNDNFSKDYSFLDGNLCRCTGYSAIKKSFDVEANYLKEDLIPKNLIDIEEQLLQFNYKVKYIEENIISDVQNYYVPESYEELFDIIDKLNGDYKFINGATDVGVEMTIRKKFYKNYIDLSRIKDLNTIREDNNYFYIGGNVTFQQIANYKNLVRYYPIINEMMPLIASQQIRNVATLAGNIANASTIADFPVLLLVLSAGINKKFKNGGGYSLLSNFYMDYKVTSLNKGEIITAIQIKKHDNFFVNFIKSSKRKKVDIASVNSAVRIKHFLGRILEFELAYGGVAPYPKLSYNAKKYFQDKLFSEINVDQAAELILEEFTPISDIRGSDDFRKQLIKNHLIVHLEKFKEENPRLK